MNNVQMNVSSTFSSITIMSEEEKNKENNAAFLKYYPVSKKKFFLVYYIRHSDKTWHLGLRTLNSPSGYVQGTEQL